MTYLNLWFLKPTGQAIPEVAATLVLWSNQTVAHMVLKEFHTNMTPQRRGDIRTMFVKSNELQYYFLNSYGVYCLSDVNIIYKSEL